MTFSGVATIAPTNPSAIVATIQPTESIEPKQSLSGAETFEATMPDGPDGEVFAPVREVLADPATGSVPALLGLLDADAETTRLAGALGLCLVALADPEVVPSVLARLSDRLDGDARPEARVAYEYLVSQFPRRADEASRERDGSAGTAGRPPGGVGREGVGRVRQPGPGSFDPRTVEPDRSVIDPADPQRHPDADVPDSGSTDSETDDAGELSASGTDPTERQRWNRLYERLSAIVEASRFDDLMVLSGRTRDRYADFSRVLAVEGSAERALALRLFHRPREDRDSFVTDLEDALDAWRAVGDHPGVVTVFDAGSQPRPWAATEPVVESLADRGARFPPEAAVSLALDLAEALSYVHQHGVIHGGLDPGNVALPATEADVARTGALDNVGLLGVYRWYVTPATCLDPRYAAPEYYDRGFGRVDHATDVYHLGAVLYRLLTGRPPVDGPFGEIRESVMEDPPPNPATVVDLPDSLARIVTKAMAKPVLRRYETINDLRGDLEGVAGEVTDGG